MPDWGWKCHNKKPETRHWLKSKSKNCADVAFETMRKELVQHDERRRDVDLCSQRPGDLLQNFVQTSVTKALTDLGHVTDTQDESEEVDGEKITQSNRKYNTGKRAIPWRGPGAQYKREKE